MGREIKRVPVNFDWPIGEVWFGYTLENLHCKACNGKGKASVPVIIGSKSDNGEWKTEEVKYCPVCEGEGEIYNKIEPPTGPGYQLWENVSEWSPMSPSFATPEELARWLVENNKYDKLPYDRWLAFITGPGYAPSMAVVGGRVMSGVEFATKEWS